MRGGRGRRWEDIPGRRKTRYEVPKRKKTLAVREAESQLLRWLQVLRDEGEWPRVGYGENLVFGSNHRDKSMSGLACVKLLAVGIMVRWTDLEGSSAEFASGSHVGVEGERRVKGRWVGMPLTEWSKFGVGELYFYFFFIPALLGCD